jgi:predicted RND superfamily exporter protein
MSGGLVSSIGHVIFTHRRWILIVAGLVTLVLGLQASRLRIEAGFEKLLPLEHPYIQTFLEYRQDFAGANRLLVAVRARQGDIFTPDFFETIRRVSDEVSSLPGVNRATVQSIFTPNVRFIDIVEGGFAGGNVIPADFRPTPEGLASVRANILRAGIVGRLVSGDFTAAMVTAELVEVDPTTRERLDYLRTAELLETEIRDRYTDENTDIHILGFAKFIGDIAAGARGIAAFFLIAFAISAGLVYLFIRSVRLTLLPLFCSVIGVVWNLGLLTWLGFALDPMSLLVPFLIFAIGVSHGVQMINAVRDEVREGADTLEAARSAFGKLVVPGSVALASDALGFLTLWLIEIPIIRELAILASLGVAVLIATNLVLLPVLLSYAGLRERYRRWLSRSTQHQERWWHPVADLTRRRFAWIPIAVAAGLLVFGLLEARGLRAGDLHAGVPELRADSRYNRDVAVIASRFSIGLDVLTTIVETTPNACIDFGIMDTIGRFGWHIRNVPGVLSTLSLPQAARIANAGWNEGHLKWRALPRNPYALSQATSSVETSSGLLNWDCSAMPVVAYLSDHRAETLERVTEAVESFAANHNSEHLAFRLATGNAGVMAATNEVVRDAQFRMVVCIYAVVVLLCLAAFRSWRAALCIILPLSLVSVLNFAVMTWLGIGLKTSTAPVAALGAGIGVDYGIYIFSRMKRAIDAGLPLDEAYLRTLRVAGSAVLVTGLTLAAGVCTWIFSDLRFQADMGLLLTFVFLANMLGAVLLLPALAAFVLPRR